MRDALKSYRALASGVTDVTRQRAQSAAKALVAQGEATAEQVSTLAEDLLSQTRQNREAVVALVGSEVDRALGRVGLASTDEVTALTERVRALESQVARLTAGAAGGASPATKAAVTSSATKAPAKNAQGAKKAPAKASPAKASPAAKAPAKKSAPAKKKSAAAKTGAKKAGA